MATKNNWPIKKINEVCEIISPGVKRFKDSKKYVATADVEFNKIIHSKEITFKNKYYC